MPACVSVRVCVRHCVFACVSRQVCGGEYSNHLRFAGKLKNPLYPSIPSSPDPNPIRPLDQTLRHAAFVNKRVRACARARRWCWKIPGANVGVDYPPPLTLWCAANGTNCTVLSLMLWWAFSISVLLSGALPKNLSSSTRFNQIAHPINVQHVEAMWAMMIGRCKLAATCCSFVV